MWPPPSRLLKLSTENWAFSTPYHTRIESSVTFLFFEIKDLSQAYNEAAKKPLDPITSDKEMKVTSLERLKFSKGIYMTGAQMLILITAVVCTQL